uniref:Uncharacterized protein n=1 Tax=Ananas comosus var. bracteatus TaxID=296719 RepID=A0A6V7PJF8_ANACO|nr:unnamed protein product [Ananas comosus var. bracteatus]
MFLTHKDDVGDHEKWSKRLKCERILHSGDVEASTADVEMKLHGEGPWSIGNDFELGSVCLYYKPLKLLFTGDHLAKSEESDDLVIFPIYNRHSANTSSATTLLSSSASLSSASALSSSLPATAQYLIAYVHSAFTAFASNSPSPLSLHLLRILLLRRQRRRRWKRPHS